MNGMVGVGGGSEIMVGTWPLDEEQMFGLRL